MRLGCLMKADDYVFEAMRLLGPHVGPALINDGNPDGNAIWVPYAPPLDVGRTARRVVELAHAVASEACARFGHVSTGVSGIGRCDRCGDSASVWDPAPSPAPDHSVEAAASAASSERGWAAWFGTDEKTPGVEPPKEGPVDP